MPEYKSFVVNPETAHSPELLHQFLLEEVGAKLLNSCQYRIEKKSIDARSRQIKANVKIGFYPLEHNFTIDLNSRKEIKALKLPKEGVVPPSLGFSQNSILSAPASIAAKAASTENTAISNLIFDIKIY